MITIGKVYKETRENYCYLCSRIQDKARNLDEIIWFKTTLDYADYFYEECADPFVLMVALPAVCNHEDIIVEDDMTDTLFYHLKTAILHMFSYMYCGGDNKEFIPNIIVKGNIISIAPTAESVGCGCSLGVDSMSSIIRHLSSEYPTNYRLTHLTYFNIGALSEDIPKSHEMFEQSLKMIQEYADKLSLPLVTLESNSQLLYDSAVLCFEQTHTFRNAAAVLSLRKLFRRYYYASGYPIEDTHVSSQSLSYQDNIILPLLATDVEFIEADADKTRVQKTLKISDNPLAQQYLHVCWHDMAPASDPVWKMDLSNVHTLNYSRCDKCLRTLSTLDVLGKIENFRNVFDLDYYYSVRDDYFFKVLTTKGNPMYGQIADLIHKSNYPLSKELQFKLKLHKYHILRIEKYVVKVLKFVKRKTRKVIEIIMYAKKSTSHINDTYSLV